MSKFDGSESRPGASEQPRTTAAIDNEPTREQATAKPEATLRQKIGATALAIVATVSIGACLPQLMLPEAPRLAFIERCTELPAQDILKTLQDIANGQRVYSSLYKKYLTEAQASGMPYGQAPNHANRLAQEGLKHAAAAAEGLTVHNWNEPELDKDMPPRWDTIYKATPPAPGETNQLPIEVYYEKVQAFLNKYGVKIVTDNSTADFSHNVRPARLDELNTPIAKQDLYDLAEYFSGLPVELIKLLGIDTVALTLPKPGQTSTMAAGMHAASGTMVLNMSVRLHQDAFAHETGHSMSAIACNTVGAYSDPELIALNHGATYGVGNRDPILTVLGADNATRPLEAMPLGATDEERSRAYDTARKIDGNVRFISQADDVEEDRADMLATIFVMHAVGIEDDSEKNHTLLPSLDRILNGVSYPLLGDKYTLLLARINMISAPIARYLIAMHTTFRYEQAQTPLEAAVRAKLGYTGRLKT